MTSNDSDSTDSTDAELTRTRWRALASATSTLVLSATAGCLSSSIESDSNGRRSDQSDRNTEPIAPTISEVFKSIEVGRHYLTVTLEDPDHLQSAALGRSTDGVIDRKQAQEPVEILLMRNLGYLFCEFLFKTRTEKNVVAEYTFEPQLKPLVTMAALVTNQDREELTLWNGYSSAASPNAYIYAIEKVGTGPAAFSEMKFDMTAEIDWDTDNGIRYHSPGIGVEWDSGPVLDPRVQLGFSLTARQGDGYRSQEVGDTYRLTVGAVEGPTGDWSEQTVMMTFGRIGEGNHYLPFEFPSENGG